MGVLIGRILGDWISRYRIIWFSMLGPLPLSLILPYADQFWTGVLTIMIKLIMAIAFASVLIYVMDLLPDRIGLIGRLFYGLNFELGGIASTFLGMQFRSTDLLRRSCEFFNRMPSRNALFQIDIAEQRPARLVRPAHHHSTAVAVLTVNHVLESLSRQDYFSSLLDRSGRGRAIFRGTHKRISRNHSENVDLSGAFNATSITESELEEELQSVIAP